MQADEYHAALAALRWQIELGADEAILDAPLDRTTLTSAPAPAPKAPAGATAAPPPPPAPARPATADPVEEARAAAAAAQGLDGLAAAMAAFPHCELRESARNFCFADGNPAARVMIVGEAPGREEDLEGRPFVGRAGRLLDLMFAEIGLARTDGTAAGALYISNVLPWRPPANRTPDRAEIAMFLPFLEAHVRLAAPEILVLMGNTPCQALIGRGGITKIRGRWTEALGLPVLPMFHPAYLLRNPPAKREAWADLLTLRARLNEMHE